MNGPITAHPATGEMAALCQCMRFSFAILRHFEFTNFLHKKLIFISDTTNFILHSKGGSTTVNFIPLIAASNGGRMLGPGSTCSSGWLVLILSHSLPLCPILGDTFTVIFTVCICFYVTTAQLVIW